jgi:hypothetical protein
MKFRFSIYLPLAVLVACFFTYVGSSRYYYQLVREGQEVRGVVVAPTCGQHNSLNFEFVAAGRTWPASGHSAHCSELRSGDPVTVWYLPDNPEVSSLDEPRDGLTNELETVGLAALVLPAFALLVISERKRRNST